MSLRTTLNSKFPFFLLIAYVIPPAFLLWFVTNFGVNVPYQDQWELVFLFQKLASGGANVQDFFAQHNEHRILFPRLIVSALALSSGWNIQWELYFNVVLASIVFLALFKVSFDQTEQHNQSFHLANIATCFIVFSIVQWENWLWGFQIAWLLINTCLSVAILAFSSSLSLSPRTKLAVAASACFVASFSSAHGLLTWIAVIPSLIACCKDARQCRKFVGLWLILFLVTCAFYLTGYHKPPQTPDVWFMLKDPKLAIIYFLSLLGSPLLHDFSVSKILGLAVFINFSFFVVRYVKNISSPFSQAAAPWLSLGCFAILFGGMTMVGRAGFGVEQAAASRYTTVAVLLIIALVQLWRLTWQLTARTVDRALATGTPANQQDFSIKPFVICTLALLVLISSITSLRAAEAHRSNLQYGQACLEVVDYIARSPDNCIQLLYPEIAIQSLHPDVVSIRDRTKILNQIGFRHFPGKTVGLVAEPTQVYGYLDAPANSKTPAIVKKSCLNCGLINVGGWAILPEQSNPARLVLLGQSNNPTTFFATAHVNLSSPDVVKVLGVKRYNQARWNTAVSPNLLPLGEILLNAWVYDSASKQFVKLRGEPTLSVEE